MEICIQCGRCCKYYCGLITISREEVKKYAQMGRFDIIKFLKWNGRHFLAWFDSDGKKLPKCPFLSKDNKCTIHDIKPFMCKKFNCWEWPGFLINEALNE